MFAPNANNCGLVPGSQAVVIDHEVESSETFDLGNSVLFVIVVQKVRPAGSTSEARMRNAHVVEFAAVLITRHTADTDIDEARADAERLAVERGRRCPRTWTSCARSSRPYSAATSGATEWAHPDIEFAIVVDGPTPAGRSNTSTPCAVMRRLLLLGAFFFVSTPAFASEVISPTGLTLTPTATSVKVEWGVSATEHFGGFNLLIEPSGTGQWKDYVELVSKTAREHTFTGLEPNTGYTVFVGTIVESKYATPGSVEKEAKTTTTQWVPPKTLTWYWQLQGTVNNSEPVAAYDIDGFENEASEVSTLHGKGIKAICYIDVGTWEEWRPDASSFPAAVKGKNNGWPGEKYLDIRALSTLEPIMTKRVEMCRDKGFDAVEPDNMDTYEEGSKTGFPLTGAEQITYDTWVAGEVHSLGMAVLQKNDGEQTSSLKAHFDGALTEECNVYSECSNFTPYLAEGKPVLNAEYGSSNAFCTADNAAGIEGARFDLELDGKVFQPCW